MSNPKTEIEIKDLRLMIKTLRELDKEYLNQFYKEAKNLAKPVQTAVRNAIPSTAPIRGMRARSERGRTAWNIGKRAKSVVIRSNRTIKRKSSFAKGKVNTYPLVQVVAQSPAFTIADMAGKTNKYTDKKPESRKYEINLFGRGQIIERTHKINGQGKALINALSNSGKMIEGKASRTFWPAALRALPEAVKGMDVLIKKQHEIINQKLGT